MAYKNPLENADALLGNHSGETRQSALDKIKGFADYHSQYDADNWEGYLTNDESDYINRAVDKYGILKSELRALHPHFFHPGNYGNYGLEDVDESLDQFRTRLGRYPNNDEYKNWLKPKIAQRVDEYKKQNYDEKSALAELDDEFGYDDLVREAYYGKPKRSDIQVWRDRAKKYAADVGDVWPYAKTLNDFSDDNIQELIDLFGFNRKGEW